MIYHCRCRRKFFSFFYYIIEIRKSCYHKKYEPDVPLVICAECGEEHKRNSKNPNGEYICKSC